MKIEKLRNKKSYRWFLCGLILVVVLTVTLIKGSRAGYKSTATIELTSGVVKYSSYDFNLISMYIDGVEQDKETKIPISGYEIDEENSFCYKDSKNNKDSNVILYTDELGNHVFKGISKGSKCILYFNKINVTAKTMNELLSTHYTINPNRTAENKDFNVPFDKTTYGVLYSAPDGDGTSYYFAGNPLDNWAEFGEYYWRIIRINGDGSIRMIYQGRTQDENGNKLEAQATGIETRIGSSSFNEDLNINEYVGFWYDIGQVHGLKHPSTVYTNLNTWFNNSNLKQEQYFTKIDLNAGFCGDRTPSSNQSSIDGKGGTGNTITYYAANVRLRPEGKSISYNSQTVNPTYNCADNLDLYTTKTAISGNHILENPVGLITADEISYAGMVINGSTPITNSYLFTARTYISMSPSMYYTDQEAGIFGVGSSGYLWNGNVKWSGPDIRPVINLRSDVTFTGDGTQSNPFKVVS